MGRPHRQTCSEPRKFTTHQHRTLPAMSSRGNSVTLGTEDPRPAPRSDGGQTILKLVVADLLTIPARTCPQRARSASGGRTGGGTCAARLSLPRIERVGTGPLRQRGRLRRAETALPVYPLRVRIWSASSVRHASLPAAAAVPTRCIRHSRIHPASLLQRRGIVAGEARSRRPRGTGSARCEFASARGQITREGRHRPGRRGAHVRVITVTRQVMAPRGWLARSGRAGG